MSDLAYSSNKEEAFQVIVPAVIGASDDKGMTHFQSFTNTAEDSLAFHASTTVIELFATQDCWVLMKPSTSSAAAAAPAEHTKTRAKFIPGGIVTFLGVPKKQDVQYMLSIVRDSTSGTLYITEGA